MFAIDTGQTESRGPWVSWTSNGSATKGFPPKSWILRGKDDGGEKFEQVLEGVFERGVVMDLDTLKLGWEHDGARGQAPDRRWSPSVSQSIPRPDDSKKSGGSYAWSRALSVRLAIGGGEAATWEQGAYGAYAAFSALAKEIMAQHPDDGTLPMVRQADVRTEHLPSGNTNIPVLEIVKWVPRPDCLQEGASAGIDTGGGEPAKTAQAPQPKAAPKPAPAPRSAPADAEF